MVSKHRMYEQLSVKHRKKGNKGPKQTKNINVVIFTHIAYSKILQQHYLLFKSSTVPYVHVRELSTETNQ